MCPWIQKAMYGARAMCSGRPWVSPLRDLKTCTQEEHEAKLTAVWLTTEVMLQQASTAPWQCPGELLVPDISGKLS
jgi:hypothetical protein